jgi:hypothetical protein
MAVALVASAVIEQRGLLAGVYIVVVKLNIITRQKKAKPIPKIILRKVAVQADVLA